MGSRWKDHLIYKQPGGDRCRNCYKEPPTTHRSFFPIKKRCNVPITSKFSRYKRPLPHCAAVLRAFSVASHAAAAASAAPGVAAALLPFFRAARLLGSHPHKVARCATSRCGLRSTPRSSCSTSNRRLVERLSGASAMLLRQCHARVLCAARGCFVWYLYEH